MRKRKGFLVKSLEFLYYRALSQPHLVWEVSLDDEDDDDALPHLATPPKWAQNLYTMTRISDAIELDKISTPPAIETG